MAGKVAETKVRITLDDKLTNSMSKVQASVDKLNNAFKSIAIGAATLAGFNSLGDIFGSQIKAGFELGIKMENARMSISGILLSMTKLKDRNLEWNEALKISDDIINDLQKKAMVTASTPSELVETFSGIVGVGLGAGLNLKEIENLTVVGANAVKSFGLQGYQLIQEMRDLLRGTITTRASTLGTSLGITNEDIKRAKEQGKLYEFLIERMGGFKKVTEEYRNTLQGAFNIAQGSTEQLLSLGFEPLRKTIKDIINDFNDAIIAWDGVNDPKFAQNYETSIKRIGNNLANATKNVVNFSKNITDSVDGVLDFGKTTEFLANNLDTILIMMASWKLYNAKIFGDVESPKVTTNLYDIYAERISKINEKLKETIPLQDKIQAMTLNAFGRDFVMPPGLEQAINRNRKYAESFKPSVPLYERLDAIVKNVKLNFKEIPQAQILIEDHLQKIIESTEKQVTLSKKLKELNIKEIDPYQTAMGKVTNNFNQRMKDAKEYEKLEVSRKLFMDRVSPAADSSTSKLALRYTQEIQDAVEGFGLANREAIGLESTLYKIGKAEGIEGVRKAIKEFGNEINKVYTRNADINEFNKSLNGQAYRLREQGVLEKDILKLKQQATTLYTKGYEEEARGLLRAASLQQQDINLLNEKIKVVNKLGFEKQTKELQKFTKQVEFGAWQFAKMGREQDKIINFTKKLFSEYEKGNIEYAKGLLKSELLIARSATKERNAIMNGNIAKQASYEKFGNYAVQVASRMQELGISETQMNQVFEKTYDILTKKGIPAANEYLQTQMGMAIQSKEDYLKRLKEEQALAKTVNTMQKLSNVTLGAGLAMTSLGVITAKVGESVGSSGVQEFGESLEKWGFYTMTVGQGIQGLTMAFVGFQGVGKKFISLIKGIELALAGAKGTVLMLASTVATSLTVALGTITATVGVLALTGHNEEYAKRAGYDNVLGYYGDSLFLNREEMIKKRAANIYAKALEQKKTVLEVAKELGNTNQEIINEAQRLYEKATETPGQEMTNLSDKLLLKWGINDNQSMPKDKAAQFMKQLENLDTLSADVIAKISSLTTSTYDAEVAKLNKEITQMTNKAKDIATATKADINGLLKDIEKYRQEKLNVLDEQREDRQHQYTIQEYDNEVKLGQMTVAQKNELAVQEYQNRIGVLNSRIAEEYRQEKLNTDKIAKLYQELADTKAKMDEASLTRLEIRWDKVVEHLQNKTYNLTETFNNGLDTMIGRFTDFGQNIISENKKFSESLKDLWKNLANDIANMMMKVYMQGLMMNMLGGLFGGGGGSGGSGGSGGGGLLGIVPGHAKGGVASGWSVVGEHGAELVNFSNPARVYTATETAKALNANGNPVNIKFNVINESGQPVQAQQQGSATFDGEAYVINVVMKAFETNAGGFRNAITGGR